MRPEEDTVNISAWIRERWPPGPILRGRGFSSWWLPREGRAVFFRGVAYSRLSKSSIWPYAHAHTGSKGQHWIQWAVKGWVLSWEEDVEAGGWEGLEAEVIVYISIKCACEWKSQRINKSILFKWYISITSFPSVQSGGYHITYTVS